MNYGIIEIDVHGMNEYQAKTLIQSTLKKASKNVYKIRIIHGYQHGTTLKKMIQRVYRQHPIVKRIEIGLNPGVTELILKGLI